MCEEKDDSRFYPTCDTLCRVCYDIRHAEQMKPVKPNSLELKIASNGFIYFAQCKNQDGYVKIGFSRCIEKRMPHNRFTDNPYQIQLIGISPGSIKEEKAIHRLLAKDNICGEWFYPTERVLTLVQMANQSLTSVFTENTISNANWFEISSKRY